MSLEYNKNDYFRDVPDLPRDKPVETKNENKNEEVSLKTKENLLEEELNSNLLTLYEQFVDFLNHKDEESRSELKQSFVDIEHYVNSWRSAAEPVLSNGTLEKNLKYFFREVKIREDERINQTVTSGYHLSLDMAEKLINERDSFLRIIANWSSKDNQTYREMVEELTECNDDQLELAAEIGPPKSVFDLVAKEQTPPTIEYKKVIKIPEDNLKNLGEDFVLKLYAAYPEKKKGDYFRSKEKEDI